MKDAKCYLSVGVWAEVEEAVVGDNLASRWGSGSLDVYATPAMIALMEAAGVEAVDAKLPDGLITVGISVDVRHLAATPPGSRVRARAELVEVDGCRLVFAVSAWDHREKIGEGMHQRYCVERASFAQRAQGKVDVR